MTRTEYMVMVAEQLNAEDCKALFGLDRDAMLDGSADWNFAIDCAYNDYLDGDDCYDDDEDDYADIMPCDLSGYCVGTSCSRYFQCQGHA